MNSTRTTDTSLAELAARPARRIVTRSRFAAAVALTGGVADSGVSRASATAAESARTHAASAPPATARAAVASTSPAGPTATGSSTSRRLRLKAPGR
jgi:hypothetical protein